MKGMKTLIEKIDKNRIDEEILAKAGEILKHGGLVAFPTETVYGLGANALDEEAAKKTYAAKGRPSDNPLIVHIADVESLSAIVENVSEKAKRVMSKFWPGPLTLIFRKKDIVPLGTTGGLQTVAVRMPENEIARALIRAAGGYVSAPSANTSGRPSPSTAQHVADDMNGRIDAIIDGGKCSVGVESTVVSLCGERPLLLRPGAVTPEMIAEAVGCCDVSHAVLEELGEQEKAESPGMKYKHYAPETEVIIVKGSFENYMRYCRENAQEDDWSLCFNGEGDILAMPHVEYGAEDDLLSQARGLFDALRWFDEMGAKRAFARCCAALCPPLRRKCAWAIISTCLL